MISFKIIKQSRKSKARLGILKTPHGLVETPTLVPVATQAAVKALAVKEVSDTKTQMLIANTFHLHLRPGGAAIKRAGGIHRFMQWNRPIMTDSGGFQVFSLGFGRDSGVGKILKKKRKAEIQSGQQPRLLKISDEGVRFTSYLDGSEIFLNPERSIRIQEQIGADIMFAFDECTSPLANKKYIKESLVRTHRWAQESLEARDSKQALYGIVQGGRYKDLREESARNIGLLPFDGFGIGGEFGDDKKKMTQMIRWVLNILPKEKPRHLLGIGYLEDIPKIIREGIDTFDCIVPTHLARHGIAFTSKGKVDVSKMKFQQTPYEKKPLDASCSCFVCRTYKRGYLSHLIRAKEISGLSLLTFHNLYFFNEFIAKIRKEIFRGNF
ncbi:MAG: tRNA guanosine(34) transglycosylase Tgt [Patescibacteria group bacterium]